MTYHWDEFSKSLDDKSVPRRESLRRLGAVFAGAVLSPLALDTTGWAAIAVAFAANAPTSNVLSRSAHLTVRPARYVK